MATKTGAKKTTTRRRDRKNIENGNHEYTESLYKLIKSYKIN